MTRPKILIIEDHPDLVHWLRRLFDAWGWDAVAAETAAQAEAWLTIGGFDLVLLDLMLPDGNGVQILSGMRAHGDPTPVMVATANDSPAVIRAVEALKPDVLFVKPVDTAALRAFVDGVYRRAVGVL